jgi:hypothetical protein
MFFLLGVLYLEIEAGYATVLAILVMYLTPLVTG